MRFTKIVILSSIQIHIQRQNILENNHRALWVSMEQHLKIYDRRLVNSLAREVQNI